MSAQLQLNTAGYVSMVDEADLARIQAAGPWYAMPASHTTYAFRQVTAPDGSRHTQKLHRFLLDFPPDRDVDHADGDGLNNTRQNLRLATDSQNGANQKKRPHCSSSFKGVNWDIHNRRWRSRIMVRGQRINLGSYTSEAEAARAYDRAASEAFGEFARLNFPVATS